MVDSLRALFIDAKPSLDLPEKLRNPKPYHFRRSLKLVKLSLFVATMLMLSACDVPFIPGI